MSDIITTLHPENDEETNLYPNIKQANIPNKSIIRSKLDDGINALLDSINELHPSGVDTAAHILAFTTNKGIYIGSDTGDWYYWNGTQYISGGTYQATIIGEGSIKAYNLNEDVSNYFDTKYVKLTNYNLFNKDSENNLINKYILKDGIIRDNSPQLTFVSDFIPVEGGLTISITSNSVTINNTAFAFFGSDKTTVIDYTTSSAVTFDTDHYNIIVPDGAYYVRFSGVKSLIQTTKLIVNREWTAETIDYIGNGTVSENIKNNSIIQSKLKNTYTDLFTFENATNGEYINGTGGTGSLSFLAHTDYIEIDQTKSYYGFFADMNNFPNLLTFMFACYDTDKTFIATIGTTSTTYVENLGNGYARIKAPINTKYIIVNYFISASNKLFLSPDGFKTSLEWLNIPNKYNGKKVAFLGDSITYGTGASDNFVNMFKRDNKLMLDTVTNAGINGSTISDNYNGMCNRITNLTGYDYIIVFGGTNDFSNNVALGNQFTLVEGVKTPNKTTSEFYGALNTLIENSLSTHTSTKLILMTPIHRNNLGGLPNDRTPNSQGLYLSDYVEAIKNACQFYGIECIDLNGIYQYNPNIAEIKALYFNDGIHPNTLGQEKLYDVIKKHIFY